jgi:cyclohexanecarboxylate-CoA ligase
MPYRGAEIETILEHSGARLFVTAALPIGELEELEPLPDAHPAPDARDAFLLLYTSGTTASPKAVPHAYRTMLGNSRLGAREHRLSAQSRILCAAPLSHLYGLYSLHCAWSVGACTVLLPAFKPDELAAALEKYKPTALWAGPAHVAACRNAGLFDRHDWSSLKLAIVSGSMAPAALVRYFAEKLPGCTVTQLWGMTELQAALYTRAEDGTEAAATSAGRPSPGTRVRISEEGELQVRGPLTFSGYFHNDEANRAAFTDDGWFRSGDLAEKRGEYYTITGRIKDVINRGGVKFNPADVEALLDAHPKIQQSAIVPMPDPVLGEKACAFVTVRPGAAEPTLGELVDYLLSKHIAKNKLPERLVVVPEMPLTPTRKIIKGRLRIPE